MALTYTALATTTVGSGGASTIEFTNIPGTYTDLVIKASTRSTRANTQDYIDIRLNSDSLNTYTYRRLFGTGSAAGSDSDTVNLVGYQAAANATASTFGNAEIYIPNYTATGVKSISTDSVNENNATAANQGLTATNSVSGSAVTTIKLSCGSGNFVQYSTATLYGIKNS